MTDTLTAESATTYARNLLASYGAGNGIIAVHRVTANADSTDDNAALDVAFTYQGGGDHDRCPAVADAGEGRRGMGARPAPPRLAGLPSRQNILKT